MKFAFFGTPDIAVYALEEMASFGFIPSLLVCNPDSPIGRKQTITPPPAKVWAEANNVPVFQPPTLKNKEDLTPLTDSEFDFFVVIAYGKIIPKWLIELPKYGTINAHPSLLPKLRGASPIRSAILNDLSAIGVTIMQMDEKLDHGPILAQVPVDLYGVPLAGRKLDSTLARMSGDLLVDVMQKIPKGEITPTPQDHTQATFCTKITKDMAEVTLDPHKLPTGDAALAIYHKICAFDGWPGTFFFHNNKRIKITEANYDEVLKILTINRIIPEGKREIDWMQYFPAQNYKGI
ncbi:MAG: methionyl-tRNA formyltransferase [Candidatus Paceibacteria bacterium]